LVQFAFFGAYLLLSIPSGYILSKIGYKKGIILGLGTMALGCVLFYPAAEIRVFWLFMLGYFTLAAGITILQVAANPYVTLLGPEETASSRLNLSQAFNSLGTSIAPAIGAFYILSGQVMTREEICAMSEIDRQSYYIIEASAVQVPSLWIAAIIAIIASAFFFIRLPIVQSTEKSSGYKKVLRNRNLMLGSLDIFFSVGAELTLGNYLINYFITLDGAELIRNTP